MDSNSLNQIAQQLDQYSGALRRQIEELKRGAADADNNVSRIKKALASEITRMARLSSDVNIQDASVRLVENNFKKQQDEADKLSRSFLDQAAELDKKISEVDKVNAEIKQLESYTRDLELKSQSWVDRARQIMA